MSAARARTARRAAERGASKLIYKAQELIENYVTREVKWRWPGGTPATAATVAAVRAYCLRRLDEEGRNPKGLLDVELRRQGERVRIVVVPAAPGQALLAAARPARRPL